MKGINLEGRIQRLNELAMNLSCERLAFREGIFPLHHVERNEYLAAVSQAVQALSQARIVLASAVQRIRDENSPLTRLSQGT